MYLSVDPARCTGCRICEAFCSFKHLGAVQPSRSRIQVLPGRGPGLFIPAVCPQCARPLCREVCPAEAIARDPATGVVRVDVGRCLGCRQCLEACPLGCMAFDEDAGAAYKCDLCGGEPECAHMCPTGAIRYEPAAVSDGRRRRERLARLVQAIDLVAGEGAIRSPRGGGGWREDAPPRVRQMESE